MCRWRPAASRCPARRAGRRGPGRSARRSARAKPKASRFALELVPDVRAPGPVAAEHVVVTEAVAEEVGAVEAAVDGGLLVLVAHHRQHHRQVGVHREPAGHARLDWRSWRSSRRPSALASLGLDEAEARARRCPWWQRGGWSRAGCTPPRAAGAASGAAWARRCAAASEEVLAVVAGERRLDEHAGDGVERLVPLLALGGPVDAGSPRARPRTTPRRCRSRPARRTRGRAWRCARPMRAVWLKLERQLDDAVAEPDALTCAGWRRRGRPRGPTSGSTPRGSGARPPTRGRCRGGRRARPVRARP